MTKIRVGAFEFTVDMSPQASLALAREGKMGDSSLETLTIRVRGDMAKEVRRETLLHEICHMAWAQTPLAELGDDVEERVVRGLSPLLHPFVRYPTGV